MRRLRCWITGHDWAVVSLAMPVQLRCLACGKERRLPWAD